jgi:hypothetical protein
MKMKGASPLQGEFSLQLLGSYPTGIVKMLINPSDVENRQGVESVFTPL